MTDLTEQWQKGELPCGWYYIKIADIVFIDFFEGKVWKNKKDEYIDEVLAPVPTYSEYLALQSDSLAKNEGAEIVAELEAKVKELKEYEDIVKSYYMKPIDYTTACETVNKLLDDKKALKSENTKLKELLKECELWFTGVVGNMNDKNVGEHNRNLPIGNFEHTFKVFSQKIDQALGEDE